MAGEDSIGGPWSDEELAAQARAGSDTALNELVRRWAGPVLAYCRRRAVPPIEAEDLAQQVLIAVFRRLHGWKPGRPFAPWLFTVARTVVLDAVRAARRRPLASSDDQVHGVDHRTPASEVAGRDAETDLWRRAREILPARQFEALELRVCAGLSIAAIAAAMGLTPTHVKVLLFRARHALLAARADQALRDNLVPAAESTTTMGYEP